MLLKKTQFNFIMDVDPDFVAHHSCIKSWLLESFEEQVPNNPVNV